LNDSRIRLIRQPTRLGILGNFNAAIQAAAAERIKPLGDDDELAPRCLEHAIEALKIAEFVSIANILWDGLAPYEWTDSSPVESAFRRRGLHPDSLRVDCISPTNIAFSRRVWQQLGPYRCGYGNAFDYDFTMRAYAEFDSVRIETPLCLFRRWELSESCQNTRSLDNCRDLAAILEELARQYPEWAGNVARRALRLGPDLMIGFVKQSRDQRPPWKELGEGLGHLLRTEQLFSHRLWRRLVSVTSRNKKVNSAVPE
jgi:hypothetical protein